MKRLSTATLDELPEAVVRPAYDRARVTPGIVHLGVGAFHRAHQAVMTDDALAGGDRGWGIVAASLRSPDTHDALHPQDGLYTLAVRDGSGTAHRVIGAIERVIVAPDHPGQLLAALASPATRIVTLTVTEKGYCHDPATGALDERHGDIVHDLASPDAPRSAPGYLVAALARRRHAGIAPFTVVCCDNLPSNGRTVKRVVARLASLVDPALGAHVEREVAFPCTMVDRIVPATTDADRAGVAAALGLVDRWPVMTEPFSQWVLEDHFPRGRPEWERGGAEFVADVAPHETMKLRMLNGAHSSMAYLGLLDGLQHVADAAGDPVHVGFVERFWGEVIPTLATGAGLDPEAYGARLMSRFRNPALRHKLAQIAMDGSQKLPQRHVATLRARLAAGQPFGHVALALAAFLRFMTGRDLEGRATPVNDPLGALFAARAGEAGDDPVRLADALLAHEPVFGEVGREAAVRGAVARHLAALADKGVRGAIAAARA